jgi:hypothetical protein
VRSIALNALGARLAASMLACAISVAASAGAAPVRPSQATSSQTPPSIRGRAEGHLYVTVYERQYNAILRYRLHGGIPEANPDGVMTGFANPSAVAVGPLGFVQALDLISPSSPALVRVYAPHETKPKYVLHLPPISDLGDPVALAVDPQSNVYVDQNVPLGFSPGVSFYVDIYAPGPTHKHLWTITQWMYTTGMAIGPGGVLAVGLNSGSGPGFIWQYAAPLNPSSSISAVGCSQYNLYAAAYDASGALYSITYGTPNLQIVVFPHPNIPSGCPASYAISTNGPSAQPRATLTVSDHFLYVVDGIHSVYVFDGRKHGLQTPLKVLKFPFPTGVAVGP